MLYKNAVHAGQCLLTVRPRKLLVPSKSTFSKEKLGHLTPRSNQLSWRGVRPAAPFRQAAGGAHRAYNSQTCIDKCSAPSEEMEGAPMAERSTTLLLCLLRRTRRRCSLLLSLPQQLAHFLRGVQLAEGSVRARGVRPALERCRCQTLPVPTLQRARAGVGRGKSGMGGMPIPMEASTCASSLP